MCTIDEEYRIDSVTLWKRGIVVNTCRRTVNKVAVVRELLKKTVASAKQHHHPFDGHPAAQRILQDFSGKPGGNPSGPILPAQHHGDDLHPSDWGEMEIPLLEQEDQEEYREEPKL